MRAPSPTKEPIPAPANDDNRDGRPSTLELLAKTISTDGGQGALFAHVVSERNRSHADATLQAKHIRVDA
ncbi:MAG: hypothetical protein O3C40_16600 [Planctomycetota bacterium]|nr:hypothetical protein [Planctomycetota bacterium]